MIKIYKTDLDTGKLTKTDKIERGVWINMVNPSEEEILRVCQETGVEQEFIKYPLDLEERARIDIEEKHILTVIDVPYLEKDKNSKVFSTMPLGMIVVDDDYFITVCLKETSIIKDFEKGKVKGFFTFKKTRFIIQIFFRNAVYFLADLKQINKDTENAEQELQRSLQNKELINMLNIEKSLVYFTTSLKSNELIMEKVLSGRIMKLYEEDEDILEDAIIENKQAIEMSKIYSDILNGTMDTYASIISNNLNVVMKFLAAITIVLSLPTIVASFFGMNVFVPFANMKFGFYLIILISVLISGGTLLWLKKRDML